MSNDWFFEKFALIADAPGAVERMRGLVLDLAVTGKLVDQAKHDQHASVILESVLTERAAFEADRTIKARSSAPVRSEDEPYKLPSNWIWARLAQIGYELGQKIPDKRFTYIDVGGIDAKKGKISDQLEVIESENAPSRARKKVALGTVIYSTVRPYLRNIAIVTDQFDPEPIASTAFGILHPFSVINNRYVFYWLRSGPFTEYVEKCMKGMAYPAINDEKFYSGYIPLPPLAEQKRIVAKVDELMGICDALESQQQERELRKSVLVRSSLSRFAESPTPENLGYLFHKSYDIPPSELRKSILTLAVQGKLVPRDPNDEPATTLITLISRQKESLIYQRIVPKASSLPPIENESLPFDVPSSWEWLRLESICELITKGSSPNWQGVQYVDAEDGVLFITSENVGNYVLRKMDEPKYVERKFNEMETRSILHRDDLLVNLVGASIGRSAVYDRDDIANINQAVGIIRLVRGNASVDRRYLLHYLNSPISLAIMFEEQVETARANLSLTNMKQFLVPVPPLAEQRRIVSKVDQLMALVDELERQQDASRENATKLLDAIVQEMTSGGQGIAARLES
jgi:type I restriction enzyme S subunit